MSERRKKGPYERFFKRPIDFCCGLAAVIVFGWLYIIIAILVRIKLGSPVLFVQERPGKDEKRFNLYKFRTMTEERDENGELLPDEYRLTKFGAWLRETSLDELPEAFNIIKGDMSVIGPRPLLTSYLPWYTEEEKHRHDVRPGLTGYAQVNGRNFLDWETRIGKDLYYINHLSFRLDCQILFKTVFQVIKRENISVDTAQSETNLAVERQARLQQEMEQKKPST